MLAILVGFAIPEVVVGQPEMKKELLLGTILLTLYYIVLFGYVWKLCMGINISVCSITVGFSPTLYC